MRMVARLRWCLWLALLVMAGTLWWGWWGPNTLAARAYAIQGIDVSHHNGEVDWKKVRQAGYEFVFIKSTEGSDWVDPRFEENWSGAQAAGMIVGAYHFFSTTSAGATQAENMITRVPKVEGGLPPVIDAEFAQETSQMTQTEFEQELAVLSERLTEHYAVEPILYVTPEFHEKSLEGREIPRLWARAVLTRPYPEARNWLFWQYSNRSRVPGIASRTDLNVFRHENLRDWIQQENENDEEDR